MQKVMGPMGDSPAGLQNEMCPAWATCLFMQKVTVLPSIPLSIIFLAASRIRSRLSRDLKPARRARSPSCTRMIFFPSLAFLKRLEPVRFEMAALTFASSSVWLTSALTRTFVGVLHHLQ